MKKLTILLIVGVLVVPNVVFGAWWNPFTWSIFNNPSESKIEQTREDQLPDKTLQEEVDSGDVYTFYLQAHTNVRSCPSLGCQILKVEPKNNTILFSKRSGYTDTSKLPEWISFSWRENGIEKSGYVYSALLDNKPATTRNSTQQQIQTSVTPRTSAPPITKPTQETSSGTTTTSNSAQQIEVRNQVLDYLNRKISEERKAYQTKQELINKYYECGRKHDQLQASIDSQRDDLWNQMNQMKETAGGTEAWAIRMVKDGQFRDEYNSLVREHNSLGSQHLIQLDEENFECVPYYNQAFNRPLYQDALSNYFDRYFESTTRNLTPETSFNDLNCRIIYHGPGSYETRCDNLMCRTVNGTDGFRTTCE